MNEFLMEDVDQHFREGLAQTMLVIHRNRLIGFLCLLTDSIDLDEEERVGFKSRGITYKSFPAVKIGRLGVDREYQHKGVGSLAVDYIVGLAFKARKYVGCRFLTVDAKNDSRSITFWEGQGFKKNLKENKANRETISYRYDLLNPLPEK